NAAAQPSLAHLGVGRCESIGLKFAGNCADQAHVICNRRCKVRRFAQPRNSTPMSRKYRVGLIVPSSNTTMETEIPAMLRSRELVLPERFSFHSSRMRMKEVTKEQLEAMDRDSDRCALELSDARMDTMGYACLVAIMSMGKG